MASAPTTSVEPKFSREMVPQHILNFLRTLSPATISELLPHALLYMENGSPLGGFTTYKNLYDLLLLPLCKANNGEQYSSEWPADPVDPVDRVSLTTLRVIDKTRAEFWDGVMLYIIDRSKPPERSNGHYLGHTSWYP